MAGSPSYITFDIQLVSSHTNNALSTTGGAVYVALNGQRKKATLYDPDNAYASLANPLTINAGKIRFAIQVAAPGGQPGVPLVDIYGISPKGFAFQRIGQAPGDVPIHYIDTNDREQELVIPYSFADAGANTEIATGFSLPANTTIRPHPLVQVVTVDSGNQSIAFGTLSSQTSGNASGFATGVSTATAKVVKPTINGASPTLGTLLRVNSAAGSTSVPEQYVLPSTALQISYTLASSSASGDGYIIIPYTLPVV